jgi:exopolyphosphatase
MNKLLGIGFFSSIGVALIRRAGANAARRRSLPSALLTQRQQYQYGRDQKLILVVGNEAGDLDSIVSSIGMAYLKSVVNKTPCVPLIPFTREEFRLRRDAVYLFDLVGFVLCQTNESPKELVFVNELDEFLKDSAGTKVNFPIELILTDHNKRTIDHPLLENAKVIEIIDHHTDSGDHPNVQGPGKRNIVAGLGSACTLVAELLLNAEDNGLCTIPTGLITLLMGTIILDSREWSPVKSGPRDREGK